jgi:glycerol-3-phosphate dehydrogenase
LDAQRRPGQAAGPWPARISGYNEQLHVSRLAGVQGETFDVVVIGGGIIGCGIARDAALRGLRVALFERRDFGSGTTSASTRIVHGGLRYLEMLDFRLVRLDLRERETLLRIAPHLVRPLEFLIPFLSRLRVSPLKLRVGLALYDALSFDKTLPSRRWLPAADARAADRALRRPDVRGAAAYHDARVDSPERLALENVLDAGERGARVFNYCEVVTSTADVTVLHVRDTLDGSEAQVSARAVVNATGAWFERASAALTGRVPGRVRTTKGIHIVVPPVTENALVLYSAIDGRLLFAIPRNGLTWIGTTDTDYDGDPADARATRRDVEYLVQSVSGIFPSLNVTDVLYTTAGVRALVRRSGRESSVSRMHKVIEGEPVAPPGVISVLGGKITGYRAIAEEVTDAVCRRLGLRGRPATTATMPLPGARGTNPANAQTPSLPAHLYDLYGTRAAEVVALAHSSADLSRQLSPKYPDIAAQVAFSVRTEHCVRLSDFLRRRTLLGASADQGWDAAAPAAELMAAELGWSRARVAEEIEMYRRDVASTQAFRDRSVLE